MAELENLSESDSCNLMIDSEASLENSFIGTRPDSFFSEIDSTNSPISSHSFSSHHKENTILEPTSPIATRLFLPNSRTNIPSSSLQSQEEEDESFKSSFLSQFPQSVKVFLKTKSFDSVSETDIREISNSITPLIGIKEKIQQELKREGLPEEKLRAFSELETQITEALLLIQEREREKEKTPRLLPANTPTGSDEDIQTEQSDESEYEEETEQEPHQNGSDEQEEEGVPHLSLPELLARIGGGGGSGSSDEEQGQKSNRIQIENSSRNSQQMFPLQSSQRQTSNQILAHGLTCSICFETSIPSSESFTLAECYHSYCLECLQKYFKVKMDSGQVLSISCPDVNCSYNISEEDIKRILSGADFSRYQHFYRLAKLRSHPDCRWCPKPNCDTYMIASQTSPQFPCLSCPTCSTKFCYQCHEEWHPKKNCKQHRKRLEKKGKISTKDELWKKEHHTKKCPRCKIDIEKLVGCNHIVCGVCNFQFCWLCLEPYSEDHYSSGPCANKCFDLGDLVEGGEGLLFLDDDDFDTTRWGKVKRGGRLIFYIGLISVTAPVVIGLAIPAISVAAPVYGGYKLTKYLKKKAKS